MKQYIEWLNNHYNFKYALPLEDEWEKMNELGWSTLQKGDTNKTNYFWDMENSKATTHKVGELLPSDIGLYDTYGNISEYCENHAQWDILGYGPVLKGGYFGDEDIIDMETFIVDTGNGSGGSEIGFRLQRTLDS